jgi:hypothetical protein
MLGLAIPAHIQSIIGQLPSLYIVIPALYLTYQLLSYTSSFIRNLRAARASGIPYVIAPWHGFDRRFLVTEPIWFPILSDFPSFLTQPWLSLTRTDWSWHYRYAPYKALGTDTIMIVSYSKNMIFTCDADVINQITTRRNDFPKPIEIYAIMDMYGKNVVTVEGAEWRRHRKITGAQLNEKSNELVWRESLYQAKEMVRCWQEGIAGGERVVDEGKKGNKDKPSVIYELGRDAMKMTLGVISRAGFGVRCLWPTADGKMDEKAPEGSMSSTTIPSGHAMSYVESLETLLHYIIAVLILPEWFLRKFYRHARMCIGTC